VELFDVNQINKIKTIIEFLYGKEETLKNIDDNTQDFKNITQLSQSIILYYKEFLLAIREKDQKLPITRELLLDADLKDMIFLNQSFERRILYSDYMLDSTPRFLFELDTNLYSLYLYSKSHNVLTQAVCFKIQNGKPYLTVANEVKYIKIRSQISDILESYKKLEPLNYNIVYENKPEPEPKVVMYLFFLNVIFIVIFCVFSRKKYFYKERSN
jgi:hypothetical protein